MKKSLHPTTYSATVECACGFKSTLLSTKGEHVLVEICSNCHPFFTGKQRFIDSEGRIERFRKKYEKFERPGISK
ncbi:MAG: 50S ribosomal protein L31 [Desulfovibrionaceae bacterium]